MPFLLSAADGQHPLRVCQEAGLALSTYAEQFEDAFTCSGDGFIAHMVHLLSLPWKLVGACVPPPAWGGGYPCNLPDRSDLHRLPYTALIGDLASHMGCCMNLKASPPPSLPLLPPRLGKKSTAL